MSARVRGASLRALDPLDLGRESRDIGIRVDALEQLAPAIVELGEQGFGLV